MGKIEGEGPSITPQMKATYKQELAHGVDLFQRSLNEYSVASDGPKKDKFKEVMDLAVQVMSETAKLSLSKQGQKAESTLEQDYQNYLADGSPDSLQKLKSDIDNLKKNI